ncbi:MAG TPA: hypothetical protein VF516_04495 [Kofleriaceae bacterium]
MVALGSTAIVGCGSDNDCDNDNNCVCDSNNNCVPAPPPPPHGALVVHNQCSVGIKEVHVAAVDTTSWGVNLISGTLTPGASLTVTVACGQYDVLLVDQAGDQSILHHVALCSSNADWIIGSDTCAAFTHKDP